MERAALEELSAQYNAQGPAWKVDPVFSGNSDYALQKLLTAMAGGKAPDIMYQYGSSLANLARSPKIVNMGDLIAKTPGYDWNDFFDAERLACTVDGKVRAVPSLVDNLCLVYNKKLFDDAGLSYPTASWTWTDFRDAAKKLTNASTKQYGWAYVADGSEDTVWRYLATLWQADGDLLNADNTKAAFDSPAGLKSMQLLYDMAVVDKSVYLDQGTGNYLSLFNSGKIAMLWTGPWDMSTINKDVQYGVEILPADVAHASIAGPDAWVMVDNGAGQGPGRLGLPAVVHVGEDADGVGAQDGQPPHPQVPDEDAGVQAVPRQVPLRGDLRREPRQRHQGAAQHPRVPEDLDSAGPGGAGRAAGQAAAAAGARPGEPAGRRDPRGAGPVRAGLREGQAVAR